MCRPPMTSISGSPIDPPRSSIEPKRALDVAALVASFIPDAVSLSAEAYRARLDVCATCIYRTAGAAGFRCAACGCFIAIKARLPGFRCPQLKWPGEERAV